MRFQRLRLRNFLSYAKATIDLDNQGLVLIEGVNKDDRTASSNGAGKSAIADGLLWVLYGTTGRGLSDDSLIKRGAKACRVSVTWSDDKGSQWKVTRARGGKVKLLVKRDGVLLSKGHPRKTQEIINKAIGLDVVAFTQAVLFTQGQTFFANLTDAEQKGIIDRLIGVEALQEARDKVSRELSVVNAEIDELAGVRVLYALDNSWRRESRTLRRRIKTWDKEHANRISQLQAQLHSLATEVEVKTLEEEHSKLKDRVDECRDRLDAFNRRMLDVCGMINRQQIKIGGHSRSLKSRVARLQSPSSVVGVGEVCAVCGSKVTRQTENRWRTGLRKEIEEITMDMVKWQRVEQGLQRKLKKLQRKEKKIKDEYGKLTLERTTLVSSVEKAKASLLLTGQLKRQLHDVETETNSYAERLKEIKCQRAHLSDEITSGLAARHQLRRQAKYLKFWVEGFGNQGLKSYLLDAVTPFVNKRASYYAGLLAGGNMAVELSAQTTLKGGEQRERISIKAVNRYGAEVYAGNSGGERRKIDLALGAALQDLAASRAREPINIRFLDEPFDSLDSTAGDHAMGFLLEQVKRCGSVFVISHREEFRAGFPRRLRVTKRAGTSRVVSS